MTPLSVMISARAWLEYWNRPHPQGVPGLTGAAPVMDCADLRDALAGLGLTPPLGRVLDVGCGTGRFAQCCADWTGADVAPQMVEYCLERGLPAHLIAVPSDLPLGEWDWVVAFSVFTHVSRAARQWFLREFAARSRRLVVDILPGREGGDIAIAYADPDDFVGDLHAAGWVVETSYERVSPDGASHRYYLCGRRP